MFPKVCYATQWRFLSDEILRTPLIVQICNIKSIRPKTFNSSVKSTCKSQAGKFLQAAAGDRDVVCFLCSFIPGHDFPFGIPTRTICFFRLLHHSKVGRRPKNASKTDFWLSHFTNAKGQLCQLAARR